MGAKEKNNIFFCFFIAGDVNTVRVKENSSFFHRSLRFFLCCHYACLLNPLDTHIHFCVLSFFIGTTAQVEFFLLYFLVFLFSGVI